MVERRKNGVVVAVDGTDGSAGALRYAVDQAVSRRSGLRIVHVCPSYVPMSPMLPYVPQDLVSAGHAILREAAATVSAAAPGIAVATSLLSGGRVPSIVTAAEHADLLVLGQETRHGMNRLLRGATTAAVTTHTRGPVVAVPGSWDPSVHSGVVVAGLKSPDDVNEVLPEAFAAARSRRAVLRIVHAWSLPDPYADRIEERTHAEGWRTAGRARIDAMLLPWRKRYPEVEVEVNVAHDLPARALLQEAEGADLLLLRRRSPLVLGLGRTARTVLAHATVPVEVVPGQSVPLPGAEPVLERSGAMVE